MATRGLRAGAGRLAAIALAAALATRAARAEDTASIQAYTRSGEAQACPDEAAFRAAVRERLGREPFAREGATHSVRASLRRRGDWFALELAIDGATRTVRAHRCDDAVRAAALTVAIALDPAIALGGRSPRGAARAEPLALPPSMPPGFRESVEGPTQVHDSEQAPPVVLWDREWVRPEPAPVRATELSMALGARLGLAMGLGDTLVRPSSALGLGLVRDRWSAALELAFDLPGSQLDADRSARVSGFAATATVLGCRGIDAGVAPFVCARATAGALVAWGTGYVTDFTVALPIAAAGARVGAELDLGHNTALRLGIDGDLVLLRSSLVVDGPGDAQRAPLFRSPPLALSFWLGARTWIF